jgi:hypothetical protein
MDICSAWDCVPAVVRCCFRPNYLRDAKRFVLAQPYRLTYRARSSKLVSASYPLVRDALGSLWVHSLEAPPWRAEAKDQPPMLEKERVHIGGVTPLSRAGLTPHWHKQCSDAVCAAGLTLQVLRGTHAEGGSGAPNW